MPDFSPVASLVDITARRLAQLFAESGDWGSLQKLLESLDFGDRNRLAAYLLQNIPVCHALVDAVSQAHCVLLDLRKAEEDFSLSDLGLHAITNLDLAGCTFPDAEELYSVLPTMEQLVELNLSQVACVDDATIRVSCGTASPSIDLSVRQHSSPSAQVLLQNTKHMTSLNVAWCQHLSDGKFYVRRDLLWKTAQPVSCVLCRCIQMPLKFH